MGQSRLGSQRRLLPASDVSGETWMEWEGSLRASGGGGVCHAQEWPLQRPWIGSVVSNQGRQWSDRCFWSPRSKKKVEEKTPGSVTDQAAECTAGRGSKFGFYFGHCACSEQQTLWGAQWLLVWERRGGSGHGHRDQLAGAEVAKARSVGDLS